MVYGERKLELQAWRSLTYASEYSTLTVYILHWKRFPYKAVTGERLTDFLRQLLCVCWNLCFDSRGPHYSWRNVITFLYSLAVKTFVNSTALINDVDVDSKRCRSLGRVEIYILLPIFLKRKEWKVFVRPIALLNLII